MPEKYQPSPEEIQKAEDSMTPEQREMTEQRIKEVAEALEKEAQEKSKYTPKIKGTRWYSPDKNKSREENTAEEVRFNLNGEVYFYQPWGGRYAGATAPTTRDIRRYLNGARMPNRSEEMGKLRRVMDYLDKAEQEDPDSERRMRKLEIDDNDTPKIFSVVSGKGLSQGMSPETFELSLDEAESILKYLRYDMMTIWTQMGGDDTQEYVRQTLQLIEEHLHRLGEIKKKKE